MGCAIFTPSYNKNENDSVKLSSKNVSEYHIFRVYSKSENDSIKYFAL